MGDDRWRDEACRLATLDRSIESIKAALRAAYESGRAEHRGADAKVCEEVSAGEQPEVCRTQIDTLLWERGCSDCAATIRALPEPKC